VRSNRLPLRKYIIHKSLTKPPEAYPDKASLPHVFVAMQLKARGDAVPVGTHIQYCITKNDDASVPVSKRAAHPDQIERADGMIQVDPEWYLAHQIHPPISRLLNPIEGTDSGRIAECLGLDAAKFRHEVVKADDDDVMPNVVLEDKERFRDCTPLQVTCPGCLTVGEPGQQEWAQRLTCPGCKQRYPLHTMKNAVTLAIRSATSKFNDGWMVCEESTCPNRTRQISLAFRRSDSKAGSEVGRQCLRVGCHGRMEKEFSDKALYTELVYLQSLFDFQRLDRLAERKLKGKGRDQDSERTEDQVIAIKSSLQHLSTHIQGFLQQSDFNMINLRDLFDSIVAK